MRFEKLVLKAFLRIQELTEAIAVESREYLLKNMPQKLPKSMHFVPEILFLNIYTKSRFEKFLAEIYECLFPGKDGGLLDWVAKEWFRLIISHYLKKDSALLKDEKTSDFLPSLDQFAQNLEIRINLPSLLIKKKQLEEEAATYRKQIESINNEMNGKLSDLYVKSGRGSHRFEDTVRSVYTTKKQVIVPKLDQTNRALDQCNVKKAEAEAEGITIIKLLNQREEILNSWYEERSQWLEKQKARDNFRTYFTWPGFVPFNDFCDFCAKYLISENGEGRQRLTEVVRSLPEFMSELRREKERKALEMVFSKTMECLKTLDTMPLEYSVNGELVPQETCMVFEMSGNCIEIDTDILPEDRNQGPHTLSMECDDNNMLKTYLKPRNEGGNLRL